jgi:hypothetical protein
MRMCVCAFVFHVAFTLSRRILVCQEYFGYEFSSIYFNRWIDRLAGQSSVQIDKQLKLKRYSDE